MKRVRLAGAFVASALILILVQSAVHAQGVWTARAPLPLKRSGPAVGAANGVVYAVGGYNGAGGCLYESDNQVYDPLSNTWSSKAPLPWRPDSAGAAVVDGVLYVMGGLTGCGSRFDNLASYNAATNSWLAKAPMPTGRGVFGVGVIDGIIYVVGGNTGSQIVATVEAYHPATNTWSTKAPMPTPRMGLGVAVVNGILYAVGGFNGTAGVGTLEAYDPLLNTWSTKSPLPTPRSSVAAASMGGLLYTTGGGYTVPAANLAEVYDPVVNTWTQLPGMPTARGNPGVAVANGSLYVIGGYGATDAVTANESFAPAMYTLALSRVGSGSLMSSPPGLTCGPICSAQFPFPASVTLTALPAASWSFASWSGSCSGTAPQCTVLMTSGRAVTATFTQGTTSQARLTVNKAGSGSGVVTSSPAGIDCNSACAADFPVGSAATLTAVAAAGSVFSGWSGGGCVGSGACTITMSAAATVTATFSPQSGPGILVVSPASLDFGAQSRHTSTSPRTVTIANTGTGPLTIATIAAGPHFSASSSCATILAGTSCPVAVVFTPEADGPLAGTLSITTSAGNATIALAGTGEKSLVTHYYRAILGRDPDAAGKAFWEAEASRMAANGANVNEAWFAMATAFFFSAEYAAFGRGNPAFVTDLYNTFFNRTPDAGGLAFWAAQLDAGLPREVLLASFIFSNEFTAFTHAIFGETSVRRELDVVVDFYRGVLSRLPDSAGLGYWVGQFRKGQCQGSTALYQRAAAISSAFINSAEYAARGRSDQQFVGDLYNSFLRRGGDLDGVKFWIRQLQSGAATREQVKAAFLGSPEFAARMQQVLAAGCLFSVASVSEASPQPFTALEVDMAGLDAASPLAVRFSDGAGFNVATDAISATSDGLVRVAIPPYVDRATGEMPARTVSMVVSQGTRESPPVAVAIQALPPLSTYGVQPGAITRAVLTFNAIALGRRISQLRAFRAVPGNTVATAASEEVLRGQMQSTLKMREEVMRLAADPALVIDLGATSSGRRMKIDYTTLDTMDRINAIWLSRLAAAIHPAVATTTPGGSAFAKATASLVKELADNMEHLGKGLEVLNLGHELLHSPEKGFFENGVAVLKSIKMVTGLLPDSASGKLIGAIAAAGSTAETCGQIFGDLAALMLNSRDPAVVNAAVTDLKNIPGEKLFGAFVEVLSIPEWAALKTVNVALSLIVSDMEFQANFLPGKREALITESRLADLYRVRPAAEWPQFSSASGNFVPAKPGSVTLCCVTGAELSALSDPDGRYDILVPVGVPQADYSGMRLDVRDPFTGSSLGSTAVDLRGIATGNPVVIPPYSLPRNCYAEYDACVAPCPVGGFAGIQCVNACLGALNRCLGI